jgi:type I restriction enzyme S subunit
MTQRIQDVIDSQKTLGAQPKLALGRIENFEIPLPKNSGEQKAIAEVLSDINAEITALEARRAKTQAIKQGMMQELLTGKTRLIPEVQLLLRS